MLKNDFLMYKRPVETIMGILVLTVAALFCYFAYNAFFFWLIISAIGVNYGVVIRTKSLRIKKCKKYKND